MKHLVMGTAIAALMISTAMAQTSTPSSPSTPSAPAASPSSPSGSGSMGTNSSTSSSAASTTGSGAMNFVTSQKPEQHLASKFTGTDVIGTDNAKIGDVSDMLFDKDGKIEAYVISVGGFLGVGSKDVAIAPSAFEVIKGTNGEADKLKLAATKDQLKQAQNFQPYNPPSTTTGTGGSMGSGSTNGRPSTGAPASR